MADSHACFVGSIPDQYERHLGPLFFEPYARDLIERADWSGVSRVLELASGTGRLTRLITQHPARPWLLATDLNPGMIHVGRRQAPPGDRLHWIAADAMALPLQAGAFDLVICQFGVMFFPDKIGAASEVKRALRPEGAFLFNVWGPFYENPLPRIAHETVGGFFASDPPAFYQVPFGYADGKRIRADLWAGGFSEVLIEAVELIGRSESAEHAAVGLVQGSPIASAIRDRGSASIDDITRAVAAAIAREFGDGEIQVPMKALAVTAR